MDEIERKTMQDIKDYVKSLDTPDNEVYQQNSLLIMACFSKAIEFIEKNAKLRQPVVISSLPSECLNGWEKPDYCVLTGSCKKCS